MKRRTFLAGSTAALALPAASRAEKVSVLKFVPWGDLGQIDPIWTPYAQTRSHAFMVYDTLYGQTGAAQNFVAKPQMVAGHVVEDDGRTWKLTLRDGLTFHDGTKVLARDCVASIRRWGARDSFGQTLMQRTNDLSAPDDRTIVFRLSKPFPLLPDALGKYAANVCAVMPERLAKTDPFTSIKEVVGSGPFRFKTDERVPGSLYVYTRFEDYKPREDGKPDFLSGPKIAYFDRVEWHINPDQGTVTSALRAGEIDWQEEVQNDLLPMLRRDQSITLRRMYSLGWLFTLRPNHLFPPFNNPAIRRALFGGINQTDCMTAAMGVDPAGWAAPVGFFPIGSPMASDVGMAALTGPRDLAKVRDALAAGGYHGETVVAIVAGEGKTIKPITDVIVDMLRKVGMPVDYQVMDFATFVQRRNSKKPPAEGGWNILAGGFAAIDCLTPASHLALRGNGARAMYGWPTCPAIETLRDRWFDAPDLSVQRKICAEIQAQAFIDVPYLPLGQLYPSTAYRADLTGVQDGMPIFWNVRRQG
jgi:peptide/nickel transport system substrate-binding protein